jgi:hypothetical protein
MIERLVAVLQAFAAGAESGQDREALVLDFDDALFLIRSCQQIDLTPEQSRALGAVESLLTRRLAPARVREAATIALRALGY